jgi:hypothetical protein
MSNQYKFLTRWRVPGTAAEVYDLISDPLEYPRWWPSVYLETTLIAPPVSSAESSPNTHPNLRDDGRQLGRRIRYFTKGWLPYTLRWESCATEADRPNRIAIRATGDFDGRGIWTFEQDADFVNITLDWQLAADKPLLRYLSSVFKPVFAANHVWAMARGQESLLLELARRHAASPEERNRIPAPPGPNTTSGIWLSFGALAIIAGGVALWLALR